MEDPGAAQFDNATVDSALRKAINNQDVDAVRRLLATPGYRFPATRSAVFSLGNFKANPLRDGTWPCTVFLLECVNAGSFKAWRAERAREMLFLRRLFTRQHRHASRDDLSLTHRLFLLRDDALFLRCLEYCWFLDPWKRYPSETDYARVRANADTEPES